MRTYPLVLLMLLPISAFAGTLLLSKAQILKIAKAQALNHCTLSTLKPVTRVQCNIFPHLDNKPSGNCERSVATQVHCDYHTNFDGKNWEVVVHPRYNLKDAKGGQAVVQGGSWLYTFSSSGKLLQELSGD